MHEEQSPTPEDILADTPLGARGDVLAALDKLDDASPLSWAEYLTTAAAAGLSPEAADALAAHWADEDDV